MPGVISTCSKCGAQFNWDTDFQDAPLCPKCGYDTVASNKSSTKEIMSQGGKTQGVVAILLTIILLIYVIVVLYFSLIFPKTTAAWDESSQDISQIQYMLVNVSRFCRSYFLLIILPAILLLVANKQVRKGISSWLFDRNLNAQEIVVHQNDEQDEQQWRMSLWHLAQEPITRGIICGDGSGMIAFLGPGGHELKEGMIKRKKSDYICATTLATLNKLYPNGECAKCQGYHFQQWTLIYCMYIPNQRNNRSTAKDLKSFCENFILRLSSNDPRGCLSRKKPEWFLDKSNSSVRVAFSANANTQWISWSAEALEKTFKSMGGWVPNPNTPPTIPKSEKPEPSISNSTDSDLRSIAFIASPDGVSCPQVDSSKRQKDFLPKLQQGRDNAIEFRKEWLDKAKRQVASQGFTNVADSLFKDPVDEIIPGWHSLAIMFDWEKMSSSYGLEIFRTFFGRTDPEELKPKQVLHFGDLIKFDSMCAILIRSKHKADLSYIAKCFGPDFQVDGLMPHEIRFLYANNADGHLIARTFSLPIAAQAENGVIVVDQQSGLQNIIEEAAENSYWEVV